MTDGHSQATRRSTVSSQASTATTATYLTNVTNCYQWVRLFLSGTVPKESKYCWLLVAISMLVHSLVYGFLNIFGVFYVQFLMEFAPNEAKIGQYELCNSSYKVLMTYSTWVGSLAYGVLLLCGPISTKVKNRLGNRVTIAIGSLICFGSILSSSFATNVDFFFGSFSVIYGIGGSLITICTSTLAPLYFNRQMPLAAGIVSSGSSIGTLVFSYGAQRLIGHIGWRNTWRFFAATTALIFLLAMFFKPVKDDCGLDQDTSLDLPTNVKLWKNRVFLIWVVVVSLVMFGAFVPFVHLVNFANEKGISPEHGSTLITIIGGSAAIGKISFGKIIEIGLLDRLHMHQLAMVVTGTCTMLLPTFTTYPLLVVYAVTVGFVSSCHTVLLPVLTTTFVGTRRMALAFGMLNCISSVFYMLGPPVAGWLHEYSGNYNLAFHMAAIPVLVSSITLFLIPWAQKTTQITLKHPEDYTILVPAAEDLVHRRLLEKFELRVKNLHIEIEVPAPLVSASMPNNAVDAGVARQIALEELRQQVRPRHTSLQEVDRNQLVNYFSPYSMTKHVDKDKDIPYTPMMRGHPQKKDDSNLVRTLSCTSRQGSDKSKSKLKINFAPYVILKTQLKHVNWIGSVVWHTAETGVPDMTDPITPCLRIMFNKTSTMRLPYRNEIRSTRMNIIYESQFEFDHSSDENNVNSSDCLHDIEQQGAQVQRNASLMSIPLMINSGSLHFAATAGSSSLSGTVDKNVPEVNQDTSAKIVNTFDADMSLVKPVNENEVATSDGNEAFDDGSVSKDFLSVEADIDSGSCAEDRKTKTIVNEALNKEVELTVAAETEVEKTCGEINIQGSTQAFVNNGTKDNNLIVSYQDNMTIDRDTCDNFKNEEETVQMARRGGGLYCVDDTVEKGGIVIRDVARKESATESVNVTKISEEKVTCVETSVMTGNVITLRKDILNSSEVTGQLTPSTNETHNYGDFCENGVFDNVALSNSGITNTELSCRKSKCDAGLDKVVRPELPARNIGISDHTEVEHE